MRINLLQCVFFIIATFIFVNVQAGISDPPNSKSATDQAMEQMYANQQQQMQMQRQMMESMMSKHKCMEPDEDRNYEYYHSRGKRLSWIEAYDGDVPYQALPVGRDRGWPLYICHTNYRDGVEVGQLVDDGCLISYAGKAFVQENYQVLSGKHRIFWVSSRDANVSGERNDQFAISMDRNFRKPGIREDAYPVKGGIEPERTLYICRTMYGDSLHVGKVVAGNCNIGINDAEVVVPTYEVLFSY